MYLLEVCLRYRGLKIVIDLVEYYSTWYYVNKSKS